MDERKREIEKIIGEHYEATLKKALDCLFKGAIRQIILSAVLLIVSLILRFAIDKPFGLLLAFSVAFVVGASVSIGCYHVFLSMLKVMRYNDEQRKEKPEIIEKFHEQTRGK